MNWSSMATWDQSVPRGGTAMGWNLSDQSSSSKTSDGNTYSIGSPGAMSLGSYSPVNYENSSYTTDYAGAAFNSVPFDNPSSSSSQHLYSTNNDNTRVTPTSLGWTPDTQLWKVYKFVVIKGKQPYLELLPGCNVTNQTPVQVFLDLPRQQKKGKQSFPCQFPGRCNGKQTVFTRPADLERHYIQVHTSIDDKPSFKCDYGPCQRAKERPFTRKDHYRDHLRDYHKEDLGSAKGEKNFKGERGKWQELQERWLAERNISPKWWRCARCLLKVYVRENGWECNECKGVCEPERRDTRQRLVKDAAVVESTTSYTSNCSTCNGTGWIESAYIAGTWDACPNCQPSAGEYDVTGTQYSSISYY